MPVTRNYQDLTRTVSCSHCGSSRRITDEQYWLGAEARDGEGHLVTDFIRYLPARGRFHSWCRACERQARSANSNRSERRTARGRRADRKFGVELELKFPYARTRQEIIDALQAAGLVGWRVKSDGSLSSGNGLEITSPPLSGDAGFEALRTACRVLREQGAKVDRQCGTHIHHDARGLRVEDIKRVARSWYENSSLIDGLVSPSRRSEANPTYCRALTSGDLDRVEAATTLSQMRHLGISRYKTLNLQAYGKFGTLEIRQHQGTCDYEKIASWVRLGQAIIDRSRTATVTRQTRVRDLIAAFGDLIDETAATFLLGRAVQFNYATV